MKTLKERLFDLQKEGHFLDVSPIKQSGKYLIVRIANGLGGEVKKISSQVMEQWEEEAEAYNHNMV